jgi:hypothetical protein
MAAQHSTVLRRQSAEVEAARAVLQERLATLEKQILARPSVSWPEAADKARYLLGLLDITSGDARVRRLIAAVLADFDRLSRHEG